MYIYIIMYLKLKILLIIYKYHKPFELDVVLYMSIPYYIRIYYTYMLYIRRR